MACVHILVFFEVLSTNEIGTTFIFISFEVLTSDFVDHYFGMFISKTAFVGCMFFVHLTYQKYL